jgi:hypothetical protein
MVKEVSDASIKVKRSTKHKLDAIGKKNDSYDDLINKLLEYYEIKEMARDQNQRIRELVSWGFKQKEIGYLSIPELDILYVEYQRHKNHAKALEIVKNGLY